MPDARPAPCVSAGRRRQSGAMTAFSADSGSPPDTSPRAVLSRRLDGEDATAALAAALAPALEPGTAITLSGALGSGKTVFARALIRRAVGDPGLEVPSPTFTLVQTYDADALALWHFDLYRIADPDEMIELDWDEALAGGVVIVEWPDRLGPLLPADRLDVRLAAGETPSRRCAHLTATGPRARRLLAALA